jgi:hypothetical protein
MRAATGLLGVDALYRADRAAGDGLVVLNMDHDGALVPQPFTSWRDAREWFEALLVEAEGLAEPDRAAYYAQLCRSTLSFVRWREAGAGLPGDGRGVAAARRRLDGGACHAVAALAQPGGR